MKSIVRSTAPFLLTLSTLTTSGALLPNLLRQRNFLFPLLNVWSRKAEMDSNINTLVTTSDGTDMPSARMWLEFQEAHGSSDTPGGAYTVLRCDLSLKSWHIWGIEFHMERLCESYSHLVQVRLKEDTRDRAIEQSTQIIQVLLSEAQVSMIRRDPPRDNETYTVMLTLLWEEDGKKNHVSVKGHAFSSCTPSNAVDYDPSPIAATIARLSGKGENFPNRYDYIPKAKVSSWCRIRRPLEEAFKINGVGEVILSRHIPTEKEVSRHIPTEKEVQLLEGLTSNLFVIFKDGTLKTPDEGVLHGYARHLVLEAAHRLGWNVDEGPLFMSEMVGWDQVFCTSAIRLIIPIGELWMLNENKGQEAAATMTKIWTESKERQQAKSWLQLYNEIQTLTQQGNYFQDR